MSAPRDESDLLKVVDRLRAAKEVVAFTGAGISTESGIPDFRSPGGVWSKYRTVYYQEFLASADARHEYWRQKAEAHRDFSAAQPNAGHRILAQDLFLAMGSSLVVEPAAGLPRLVRAHGGMLVIINRDPTPLDSMADVVIHAGIGDSLTAIDAQLR